MAHPKTRTPANTAPAPPTPWSFPLVALPVFSTYLWTLNPSLFRNDSPETITACWTLGVSHPPGYPLFTLLGRLFTLAPLGNPALTLNLFAALCGTLGAFFFFKVSRALLERLAPGNGRAGTLAALAATYAFALSKSQWSASLAAKGGIYSFQATLELAALAYAFGRFRAPRTPGELRGPIGALVFLCALGLTHQWPTESLLLAAGLMVLIVPSSPGTRPFPSLPAKTGLAWATWAVLALSLYLFVPLRASQAPALDFGDPSHWDRFAGSLLRVHYFRTETMASSLDSFWPTLSQKSLYLSDRFSWEFPLLFSFSALWGIRTLWWRGSRTLLSFLLTLALVTVAANLLYLQAPPVEFWHLDDHLLTLNWVTGLLGAAGILSLFSFLWPRPGGPWAAFGLVLLLSLLGIQKAIPYTDQTREFLYRGVGMQALRSMDRDPRYFAESDFDYFSLLYLREVEGKRKDLDLRLTTFLDERDWAGLAAADGAARADARPRYCAFTNGDLMNGLLKRGASPSFYPTGTLIRFSASRSGRAGRPDRAPLDDLWDHYLVPALSGEGSHAPTLNPINGLMAELCAHPYLDLSNYLRMRNDLSHWDRDQARALSLVQDARWRGGIWADKARADLGLGRRPEAASELQKAAEAFELSGDLESSRTAAQLAAKLSKQP